MQQNEQLTALSAAFDVGNMTSVVQSDVLERGIRTLTASPTSPGDACQTPRTSVEQHIAASGGGEKDTQSDSGNLIPGRQLIMGGQLRYSGRVSNELVCRAWNPKSIASSEQTQSDVC
jgi:hypothetical protein